MSQTPQPHEAPEPPAMGERRARWGYGYQDKVATDRILRILKDDLRGGSAVFEGVRIFSQIYRPVDIWSGLFVLVWNRRVEGHSIKWSGDASPMIGGAVFGAKGLLKRTAQGFWGLRQRWPDQTVTVRLESNRPSSRETRPNQMNEPSALPNFCEGPLEERTDCSGCRRLKGSLGHDCKAHRSMRRRLRSFHTGWSLSLDLPDHQKWSRYSGLAALREAVR